ncbi:CLUMA_CG005823, isoform A [Clunio marinus]|uniref:CLUMA_CG005823, isoform A n=1 Tax=Clunio marinus TaxID=568069 RepID=A0A1J1HXY1_9DIPT|nr:CLUMA_CG005823, isoform A [Clunio marinus]
MNNSNPKSVKVLYSDESQFPHQISMFLHWDRENERNNELILGKFVVQIFPIKKRKKNDFDKLILFFGLGSKMKHFYYHNHQANPRGKVFIDFVVKQLPTTTTK